MTIIIPVVRYVLTKIRNQHSMIKRIAEFNWGKEKRHKMQIQIALCQIWSEIETVKESQKI